MKEEDVRDFERRMGRFDGSKDHQEEGLSWLKFESVDELPETEPARIIEGILHIGEKLGITAASKGFKTWLLLYLGYCIANGFPFLGFETRKSKIVIFDLELTRRGVRRRLKHIQKELGGEGDFDNLKICCLRGKARRFCGNLKAVREQIREQNFEVVIIDP